MNQQCSIDLVNYMLEMKWIIVPLCETLFFLSWCLINWVLYWACYHCCILFSFLYFCFFFPFSFSLSWLLSYQWEIKLILNSNPGHKIWKCFASHFSLHWFSSDHCLVSSENASKKNNVTNIHLGKRIWQKSKPNYEKKVIYIYIKLQWSRLIP